MTLNSCKATFISYFTTNFRILYFYCLLFYSDDMSATTLQYNLRSNGQDALQLPVELHMVEDRTFLLAAQRNPPSGQVSDNDSSINDSDCEALIASSGDEHDSCSQGTSQQTFVKNLDPTLSDTHDTSQQALNIQILAQLQSLGSRPNAMEKKSCEKSTDTYKIKNKGLKPTVKPQTAVTPPPVHQNIAFNNLQTLRQDDNLQIQVEKTYKNWPP